MTVNPFREISEDRRYSIDNSIHIDSVSRPWSHSDNQRDLARFVEEVNKTKVPVFRVDIPIQNDTIHTGIREIDSVIGNEVVTHIELEILTRQPESVAEFNNGILILRRAVVWMMCNPGSADEIESVVHCARVLIRESSIEMIPA
ncbi:MAG TPA: hypothetical protein VJ841_00725 [Candidatus Saccharimonadales bacterium]|nr:hypothetical protein [Candidatus Saccharimonadales bacterium]